MDPLQTSRKFGPCDLCEQARPLTFHHLIPRTLHSNKWFRKRFDRQTMQRTGLMICRICHNGIHKIIPDAKDLARNYRCRDDLLAHPGIERHVAWSRKQR